MTPTDPTARDGIDLDEVEARANAATLGPWVDDHMNVIGTRAGWWSPIRYDAHRVDQDAEFIAHARTDVPALVAELRQARAAHAAAVARLDAALGTVTP